MTRVGSLMGAISALFVFTLPPAAAAHVMPVEPVTLWSLVQGADVIVVGKVVGTSEGPSARVAAPLERTDFRRFRHHVRLSVLETWKGTSKDEEDVAFHVSTFTGGPSFGKGARVLVFLRLDGPEMVVVANADGALSPDDDDLPVFRERVREAMDLQRGGESARTEERRAWTLRTAARAATRWHGLEELASSPPSPAEIRILAEGFIAEPRADRTLPTMLALLARYESRRVDDAAVVATDAMMRDYLESWSEPVVPLVLARFARRGTITPARVRLIACEGNALARFRDCWRDARTEFGLPPGSP